MAYALVLAGGAAVVAYTLDAIVGHHSARYERFGWAAVRLDDLLTWSSSFLGSMWAGTP